MDSWSLFLVFYIVFLCLFSLLIERMVVMEFIVSRCTGEGVGSCKRCSDNGKFNRTWMCFLYKIVGFDGCYCSDCVKELIGTVSKVSDLDINCSAVDIDKPTE